ncbi:MAG TPA: hypothetical protein VMY42_20630 [Thermoguttaceae bacterium]|nr:hypothetical protein [Thermoguttaceae bacterium]
MALELLVDCNNMAIGAIPIARPETAEFPIEPNELEAASNAVFGPYENDTTFYTLRAVLTAQDPLIVGTVAALTDAQVVSAEGQLANTATYRKLGLQHGVLTSLNLDIVDNQQGRTRFEFLNRAPSPTATIADEYAGVAGSAPTLVDRKGTIRIIAASSAFTPDGGSPITLDGLQRLNWQATAILADGDMRSSPGALLVDQVTIAGWRVLGTIGFGDKSLATTQTLAAQLAVAVRGTLVVRVRLTGFAGESPAPTDYLITMQRIKFGRMGESLRTKQPGSGDLGFSAILRAANQSLLGLGDMISAVQA